MMELPITREELLDVALLDVVADAGPMAIADALDETQDWCSDHESWLPDVWPLLETVPTKEELEARLEYLTRLGMVRRALGEVAITLAGYQMWDAFPWEYVAEEEEER
jgi:hypothetical protein